MTASTTPRPSGPPTSGSPWAPAPEVARKASRMILSDDNFATIVFAVEMGRELYDNLLRYLRFVLVLLVVFVLTFLGAAVFNSWPVSSAGRVPRARGRSRA